VRPDVRAGDYRDPGWYRHPQGTQAREWTGAGPPAARAQTSPEKADVELKAQKPSGHSHH